MECSSRPLQKTFVRGVNKEKIEDVILDSGADVSGLPMTYTRIGQPLAGCSIVHDA